MIRRSLADRSPLLIILSVALLCCSTTAGEPQERPITPGTPSEIPLRLVEVKPDIYLITGRGANSVVYRTPDGLILIDNKVMYASVWRELTALLQHKISSKPIRYAFITHHHADSGGNNQRVIDSGAELIGQENIISILKTYTSIIAPVNPAFPTVTFKDRYSITLGGVVATAYYWGPSHTNADIAVYFPDQKVVAVGDMIFSNGEPAVDAGDGHGSLFGMLERIDNLLNLDFELAIPGHGDNVMTRKEVVLYKERFEELIERGKQAISQGATIETFVDAMKAHDLGFRLHGHLWEGKKYKFPLYQELLSASKKKAFH